MRGQKPDTPEVGSEDISCDSDNNQETNPVTKLERRRRIEDLLEKKRMMEELGEYDLL